ncbi:hypothetical protein M408DRAFT_27009 [Serendipita vermifera MAFF 305830]|uniref:F-box domain-containing protein n=1 Tax=Serendipita vermifera MAFF 305830 TaxID=933852 RepID=A0A0C3AIT7_SERVB|nr:hypothetical protein M408DRAFT_27009 [Serendipita vermifera MAFF 305830]
MSSKASVEIWHTILKYAISVPIFLDVEFIQARGIDQYSYQYPYWQAERIRNTLRRVCHAWSGFLKLYDHRFIRIDDVIHKRVPLTALPSAIRIDLEWIGNCSCAEYCNSVGDIYWDEMQDVWMGALCKYDTYPWKLEIIGGCYGREHMHALGPLVPNLRVMVSQEWGVIFAFGRIISDVGNPLGPQLSMSMCAAANLGTIHMTDPDLSMKISITSGEFPSLRHLIIDVDDMQEPFEQWEFHTFLQYIGPQLRTFHYRYQIHVESLDSSLWSILPNVESIQLPFRWTLSDIPKGHPLKRVQVAAWRILDHFNEESTWDSALSLHCPLSSQRKLSYARDVAWRYLLFEHPSFSLCIWSYFEDNDAHLEDVHGDTLFQYIIFLIKAFWKQPHRTYCRTPSYH